MENYLNILKALADNTRLRIFFALDTAGQLCPCQLNSLLQLSGATISRHLNIMTNAGIVNFQKRGRWMFYEIRPAFYITHSSLLDWLQQQKHNCPEYALDQETLQKIMQRSADELCREQRGEICCPKNKMEKPNGE